MEDDDKLILSRMALFAWVLAFVCMAGWLLLDQALGLQ